MLTPCRKVGCKRKGTKKHQGFCELHKDESGWPRNEKSKGNRHQRGYGNDWEKLRELALERDEFLCVSCDENDIVKPATTVDHIIPKAHGGTDDLDNLQSLCDCCHKEKTANERFIKLL